MEEELAVAGLLALLALKRRQQIEARNRKQRRARRWKVRFINRDRLQKGFFRSTFLPMKEHDPSQFFKYTRMDVGTFTELSDLLRPVVKVRKLHVNKALSLEERLALTLHYLSQGSSMQTIAWKYKIGKTTVHCVIKEMCQALYQVLEDPYLQPPTSEEEWLSIAAGFENTWNFPHCLGALDGKHINLRAPPKSGSLYFNYKKTFSLVLLAICDDQYIFKIVEIGAYGSSSDGGILLDSVFGKNLTEHRLKLPSEEPIRGYSNQQNFPYFFVADAAFPLGQNIMRPYPGHVLPPEKDNFNTRLSRARRVIENAFGILAARWRLLLQTINAHPSLVEDITKACVCLHNFLRVKSATYCPPEYADTNGEDNGMWRRDIPHPLTSVRNTASRNSTHRALHIRDALASYLEGEGAI